MPTIAIIGASKTSAKFGNKAVRAYLKKGWQVFPVNPKEKEIEGLKTYPSVLEIPVKIDRVSLYLPPEVGLTIIREIAKKKPKEVFFNPGTAKKELIKKAKRLDLKIVQGCSILAIGENPKEY